MLQTALQREEGPCRQEIVWGVRCRRPAPRTEQRQAGHQPCLRGRRRQRQHPSADYPGVDWGGGGFRGGFKGQRVVPLELLSLGCPPRQLGKVGMMGGELGAHLCCQ